MDDLFGPKGWGGYHPSLSDVIEREAEIAAYELSKHWYEMARIVRGVGIAVFGILAVAMVFLGHWLLAAFFSAATFMVGFWSPRPPLGCLMTHSIIPFSDWENENLLLIQPWDDFLAWCVCPSCGYVDAHRFRQESEPWADVVRVCSVCNREWAQA